MTTQRFNRGISDEFVGALNNEYGKGGWWRNFVDDPETFLAIRGGFVNVYYLGCSLLKLWFNNNGLEGEVHYKYFLRPDLGPANEYIRVKDRRSEAKQPSSRFFLEDIVNVADLKKAAKPFAEEEKKGVHKIIHGNPNVLDVEVAISDSRIDLAALHEVDGGFGITFYEAKRFADDRSLRARKGNPEVIRQINTYAELLSGQRTDIEDSYRKVCRNLSALDGVAEKHPGRHKLLTRIAKEKVELHIDTKPHLLVFDFDADQRDGKVWKPHRCKLGRELGSHVTMTGDPGQLTLQR